MNNKVEVPKQQDCVHHWIIDTPDGESSYGKCKRCGKVAVFSNVYISDFVNRVRLLGEMPTQPI
jgi:hypothetical protein